FKQEENQMAKKDQRLCKWKEDDISKYFDKYLNVVRNPKFVCKKCGRVANKKGRLHKPASFQ
ncbi:MAG: hypothetical protein ABUJ92_08895, partial [Desulfobacterales bacterium]